MHYTIFSCSPQNQRKSTSALIAETMSRALSSDGDTASVHYINDKKKWQECRKAFYETEYTLFVMPLYVEGVPGLLLEFLESIDASQKKAGKMAFIIQGGFEEASQLRVAEEFLMQLPGHFNCEYAGTLVKGGLFGMATMRGEKDKERMVKEFQWAAERFKEKNAFDEETARKVAGIEYYSKGMLVLARLSKPLNRIVWYFMGKKMGSQASLTHRPYSY